jgi:hypothetical protein
MSNPVEAVTYVRIHPDTTWHAPGREDQPGTPPGGAPVYPAPDLYPSPTRYPGS